MTFIKTFLNDDSGASAAEYALILAVVGAGIAAAAFALGGAITTAISGATAEINTGGAPAAPAAPAV
jgi:pilus assembly protein Flp/PilA